MRAFRYRLNPVLRRAQHREQSLQVEVARLRDDLARAARQRQHLLHLRERLREVHRALQRGEIDLPHLHALGREIESVERMLADAARLAEEIEDRLETTRRRLVEALQARQALEHHRDTLAERHRREQMAVESKHLDDLATTRFANSSTPMRSSG